MPNTLKALAGDSFRTTDIAAALHAKLLPDQIVLDRYVFLPFARTGIAAALSTPFAWDLSTRAMIDVRQPVGDETRGTIDAEMQVQVYGPADVTAIDPRQIVRTVPRADADSAEIDDLVHVEFDRPDMPWLFTPAGPDAAGRLTPWLTLIVVERHHLAWGEQRGEVRSARVRRDQLQPLGDAWAWAHAQVMGAKGANNTEQPTLEQRLSEENAAHNVSRLICPRRLAARTDYVACLVPTFLAGAQAALGLTPVSTLAPAWGSIKDFDSGDTADMVTLPIYFSWSFSTGDSGNFESLARKLKPAAAPPGVGRRRLDATRPWPGPPLAIDDPGAEMVISGPVVSLQAPETALEEHWPAETAQHWAQGMTDTLIEKLNIADQQAYAPLPASPLPTPPVVSPPLYGGRHAQQARVETTAAASNAQPLWFRELNTDPRHRVAAGIGARVIQMDQEDLMLAAWNQVTGINAANRTLRLAQLAMHAGAALHRRHLSALPDAPSLGMTDRVHGKLVDTPARSIWASLDTSSLPHAVTMGAFRRLARTRGAIVRTARRTYGQLGEVTDNLMVRSDRMTANWVRPYITPDGVCRLSDVAAARITPALAKQCFGDADVAAVVQRLRKDLAKPAAPDRLLPEILDRDDPVQFANLSESVVVTLVRRVVRAIPTEQDMVAHKEAAATGSSNATLLRMLFTIARSSHIGQFQLAPSEVRRLRLHPAQSAAEGARITVSFDALDDLVNRVLAIARRQQVVIPTNELEMTGQKLAGLVRSSARIGLGQLIRAFSLLGSRGVAMEAFDEPARHRVTVPSLQLVAQLDPRITVPRRIRARLAGGSGRIPSWLRTDWFTNDRIEPVMAHPRFAVPMYEPLYRYDPDWMIPGLGLIPGSDMATLLQTNSRFIEAYLVGLNHEMAGELLWRGYPTDQRGTYFSSFWTGAPELVADMHERPWAAGALGAHMKTGLDGQIVLLVRGDLIRRYPGVVAHAVLQNGRDGPIPTFASDPDVKTLFHVHLPPNLLLVGFSLTSDRIHTRDETWWFTLSENPTEPRFGLDPSRDGGRSRDQLIWDDFGTAPGQFLDPAKHSDIFYDQSRWGTSSAQVAYLLFQLPARAAFKALKMLGKAQPNG
jgi:hypothetical protein